MLSDVPLPWLELIGSMCAAEEVPVDMPLFLLTSSKRFRKTTRSEFVRYGSIVEVIVSYRLSLMHGKSQKSEQGIRMDIPFEIRGGVSADDQHAK